jgi:glycosyltransferase involved in cell wall biosynthesis
MDALIAPSKAHAREISLELGDKIPPLVTIPNTTSFPLADSTNRRPDEDIVPETAPIVLYSGRLERTKGIITLIEAAQFVLEETPQVHFVLAGGGHELKQLVSQDSLKEHTHLLGHIPRDQLAYWYCHASVCVMPSFYETFGISALEAMIFGKPVVATNIGGLAELVEDGVTGLLVKPGDACQLADAILFFLQNPQMREMYGAAGLERAAKLYNVDKIIDSTLTVYRHLSLEGREGLVDQGRFFGYKHLE